jgi:hypothetical protein
LDRSPGSGRVRSGSVTPGRDGLLGGELALLGGCDCSERSPPAPPRPRRRRRRRSPLERLLSAPPALCAEPGGRLGDPGCDGDGGRLGDPGRDGEGGRLGEPGCDGGGRLGEPACEEGGRLGDPARAERAPGLAAEAAPCPG